MMAKVNGRMGKQCHPRFQAQIAEANKLESTYTSPNTSAGDHIHVASVSDATDAATNPGATS